MRSHLPVDGDCHMLLELVHAQHRRRAELDVPDARLSRVCVRVYVYVRTTRKCACCPVWVVWVV